MSAGSAHWKLKATIGDLAAIVRQTGDAAIKAKLQRVIDDLALLVDAAAGM